MALAFKKYEYTELRDLNSKINITELNDMLQAMNYNLSLAQSVIESSYSMQMNMMEADDGSK